jgi:hypothetical protein
MFGLKQDLLDQFDARSLNYLFKYSDDSPILFNLMDETKSSDKYITRNSFEMFYNMVNLSNLINTQKYICNIKYNLSMEQFLNFVLTLSFDQLESMNHGQIKALYE